MSTLKYDVESKLYTELKSLIVAPKFQRNFVWRKKARKELINSIKNGLPIGMQLIGKAWDEKTLFQVAHAYESKKNDRIDARACHTVQLSFRL